MRVQLRDEDLRAGIDALGKRFPQTFKRALARTATTAEAAMARAMVQDTALPVGKIKEAISQRFADQGVQLVCTGKRIPLIDFRARGPEPSRGKGRGVTYTLPGGKQRAEHAFISTMPSGHRGVFERTGRFTRRPSKRGGMPVNRETIRELFGPSIVKVFEKFLPLGATVAAEALMKNLQHEIQFALSRR